MKHDIRFSKNFKKSFKRLSPKEQKQFDNKFLQFKTNPYHPSLRTKKLQGQEIIYASSVNMSIRILWRYENDTLILFLDIGHHDILKRK